MTKCYLMDGLQGQNLLLYMPKCQSIVVLKGQILLNYKTKCQSMVMLQGQCIYELVITLCQLIIFTEFQ